MKAEKPICNNTLNINKRKFWIDHLSGDNVKVGFVNDIFRTGNGYQRIHYICKDETSTQVLRTSNHSDYNLFTVLLSSMLVMLYRYQGKEEIIIDTQSDHKDSSNSLLLMKSKVSGEDTFREILKRQMKVVNDCFKNEDFSYESLLSVLNIDRIDELYDIGMVLTNLQKKSNLNRNTSSIFYEFTQSGKQLLLDVSYNSDQYKSETINQIAIEYDFITYQLLKNPDEAIQKIDIVPEKDKIKLFEQNNKPILQNNEYINLCQYLEIDAKRFPNHIAYVDKEKNIAYKQLDEKVNRISCLMREKGIHRNVIVAVLCKRSIDTTISFLSILRAGGVFLPLDPAYPTQHIENILVDSKTKYLVTESVLIEEDEQRYFELISKSQLESILIQGDYQDDMYFSALSQSAKLDQLMNNCGKHEFCDNDIFAYHGSVITYQEMRNQVENLIRRLDLSDLSKSEEVAIFATDPYIKALCYTAICQLNLEYVSVDIEQGVTYNSKRLEDMEFGIGIVQDDIINIVDEILNKANKGMKYLLVDRNDIGKNKENTHINYVAEVFNAMVDRQLDDLNGYGWDNSYDGQKFSQPEMLEYIHNFEHKLTPYLGSQKKILEIGCGHGLVYKQIRSKVGSYYGIDVSDKVVGYMNEFSKEDTNSQFFCTDADKIDQLNVNDFDIIIISSVVHYFTSSFYFEDVLKKAMRLLKSHGIIYVDDMLNLNKKDELIESIQQYHKEHKESRSKLDWDKDLFISPKFFEYFKGAYSEVRKVEASSKIGTIENELHRFRYDVLLEIDKTKIERKNNFRREIINISNHLKPKYSLTNVNHLFDISSMNSNSVNELGVTDIINKEDDLCYIIYTSGSTGKPKGVMIQHKGMMNHIHAKIEDLEINSDSRIAQNASQCFDISVWQLFTSLFVGAQCYIYDNDTVHNIDQFLDDIVKEEISVLEVVPSYLSAMIDIAMRDHIRFNKMRYLVVTGEEVKVDLVNRWLETYPDITIVNAYGPTEASDDITHHFMNKKIDCIRVPVGKPIRNMRIYIVDQNVNLCPIGCVGEIVVSGIGVGKGYLNNEIKTQEVFGVDPFYGNKSVPMYKTGDLGRYLPDGTIEYYGRKDEQVKIRGFRIEIQEIESKINSIPGVKDSVIVNRSDKNGMHNLYAYYVSQNVTKEEVEEYLSTVLPQYMVPQYMIRLSSFPLSSNGKIDKKRLPEPFEMQSKDKPRTELEKSVATMWMKLLDVQEIDIDCDFFTIGGHSLKAAVFISNFNHQYNSNVSLAEFFKVPNIREFCTLAKDRINVSNYEKITKAEEKTKYRLSPQQLSMYIVQKSQAPRTMYNIPMLIQIQKVLDLQKVEDICYKLILRHEGLRTSFMDEDGETYQYIHDDVDFFVNNYEVEEENKESIGQVIKSFIRPFDLEEAPLFRVGIIHVKNESSILLVDVHHIIFDAQSQSILMNEFVELYNDEEAQLPNLALQYKDYAEWLYSETMLEKKKREESYWVSRLKGVTTQMNLPIMTQRTDQTGFAASSVIFEFNENEMQGLYDLAHESNATVYMLVMAAFDLCLAEICKTTDVSVGTVVAGRQDPMLKNVIGMFVNTLVIYNHVDNGTSYKQFIQIVKDHILQDFENQDYPFEELVSKLHAHCKPNRNPLFDVMLVYQNTNFMLNKLKVADVFENFSEYKMENDYAKFDLSLFVDEIDDNLRFRFEYKTALFDRETVERIIHCFREKLLDMMEYPEKQIDILMD